MSRTPGPWRFEKGPFLNGTIYGPPDAKSFRLIVGHLDHVQRYDDGHLMAAAPDLYALCQRLEAECRNQLVRFELEGLKPDGPVVRHWTALLDEIAAVLARANGIEKGEQRP